jgi:ribonuclease-3
VSLREPPELDSLEEILGYRFRDPSLLATAVRHASFAHENDGVESNERLEFLGDAVIGLAVAQLLFEAHPEWREGDLTRALHALVDREALAGLGRTLQIGPHLRLGRTERVSEGSSKDTILADAVEAVIGAVFLDGGIEPVRELVRRVFASALATDAPRVERDPKTLLQEQVMALHGEFPRYQLVTDTEVEGDESRFSVQVMVKGEGWGLGIGRSKRVAERAAAEAALPRLYRERVEAGDG